MTDIIATLERYQSALHEAEKHLMMAGDRAGAEKVRAAMEPLDFKSNGKEPAIILITGRARCSCDNAEVVTESVTIPYGAPDEQVAWIMSRLLRNLRAEVSVHILKQGHTS